MKFYAFNDEGENSSTINLILDHNTTATVAWINQTDFIAAGGAQTDWNNNIRNNKGPLTALKQLKTDTENWTGVETPENYTNSHYNYTVDYSNYGGKARLITAQEVANITDYESWNESSAPYYLDSKNYTSHPTTQGESNYYWLFDYTKECISYGCNIADSSTRGYWTITASLSSTSSAWAVDKVGSSTPDGIGNNSYYGLRPVIKVLKSKLS